jgi:MSHA biogenesis protein MshM
MYYDHFGLDEAPFKITPDTRLFYEGGKRGDILDALGYAITSGEGIVKVVGEVGSGKTMLSRMLEVRLSENVDLVYLANPSIAPGDIPFAIGVELGLNIEAGMDRIRAVHLLQQSLLASHAKGRQVVCFVEEAQSMPLETLEEIRLLSNLETHRAKLLQIVLFGQPELDINLDEPSIRQLRERIVHSFYLDPLGTLDVGSYVSFRMRAVGYRGPDVFTRGALKLLSKTSQGLIRRVNILGDKALLAAFAENSHEVTEKHARTAIRDSEFGRLRKAASWPKRVAAAALLVITLGAGAYLSRYLPAMGLGEPWVAPAVVVRAAPQMPAASSTPIASESSAAVSTQLVIAGANLAPIVPDVGAAMPVVAQPPGASNAIAHRQVARQASQTHASQIEASQTQTRAVQTAGAQASQIATAATSTTDESVTTLAQIETQVPAAPAVEVVLTEATSPLSVAGAPIEQSTAISEQAIEASSAEAGAALRSSTLNARRAADVEISPEAAVAAATAAVASESASVASVALQPLTPQSSLAEASSAKPKPSPEVGPAKTAKVASDAATATADGEAQVVDSGPAPLLESRLEATREWLGGVDGERYSIQLMMTSPLGRRNLEDFLQRWNSAGDVTRVYVYLTTIGTAQWYGVLYDEFKSLQAAQAALARLPESLKRHGPYVRNVRDISGFG